MRAVIEYHQAALQTADLNQIIREVKWHNYNEVLAEVLEPTLLAPMTEDWYRGVDLWPPEELTHSPLEEFGVVDLSRLRSSQAFRTALARNLNYTVVQIGDLHRMRQEAERVLATAEDSLGKF